MPEYVLGESSAEVYNPLPETTMEDVCREAKLPIVGKSDSLVFKKDYRWSTGAERQNWEFKPQSGVRMPTSVARMVYKDLRDLGFVLITEEADRDSTILKGLQSALKWYQATGGSAISKWRARHGLQDKEMYETRRHEIQGMLKNQAKEKFILKEIDRYQKAMNARQKANITIKADA